MINFTKKFGLANIGSIQCVALGWVTLSFIRAIVEKVDIERTFRRKKEENDLRTFFSQKILYKMLIFGALI